MYGVMLARSIGARTIAFGTHVTPMPFDTMRDFPALDFVLRGEPELTLRELIDALEGRNADRPEWLTSLLRETDPAWQPSPEARGPEVDLTTIKGLVYRANGEYQQNPDRPFLPRLDTLPIPNYDLLPLDAYRMPLMKGPFCFIVTSRGCPAGCKYCIKHVSYQWSVRLLSPERVVQEIKLLYDLGIKQHPHVRRPVHGQPRPGDGDLPADDRAEPQDPLDLQQPRRLRRRRDAPADGQGRLLDDQLGHRERQRGDPEEGGQGRQSQEGARGVDLGAQGRDQELGLLHHRPARRDARPRFARPSTSPRRCRSSWRIFHIAAPYPGTPFFFEVVKNGWFRPGTQWEQVDMDKDTVLQYDNLSAEDLMYWQRRAFREWALRPGPAFTYLKMLTSDPQTFKRTVRVGLEHFSWMWGGSAGKPAVAKPLVRSASASTPSA